MNGSLYGGQVLAQALIAAQHTVEKRDPHSMHAYFLRAGSGDMPVIYDVDPIRDGGSFTTRRVVARQKGRAIFNTAISFHKKEPGLTHQISMSEIPCLPNADEIQKYREIANGLKRPGKLMKEFTNRHLFDFIPVGETPFISEHVTEPHGLFWFRCTQKLTDDIDLQRGALTFASDMGLLAASLFTHPSSIFNGKHMVASLDHALWFHTPCNTNDWLLYQVDSPWAGNARGFTRGLIYSTEGKLIASTTQEGLIRPLTK
jgi:acyl-CoA thioesterase-2